MRTDSSLARRAAAGDEAAFEAIFRRYHQEIYRYCRAILRSEEDARDALQSTMVAALRALPGEEREVAIRPWLYRVAHNEAISILRARQPLVDPDRMPETPVAGADHQAGQRERLKRLVSDLGALPDRQRSAIVMRELSGLSFAEIADAQDSSEAAVRQMLYEARAALVEMQEGRDLNCVDVRYAISDGDGRRLRGRRLRAHLRSCEGCTAYQTAITSRQADLQVLCPPLPAALGAGVLASVLASHGSGAATGAGVGTAAGAAGGAAGAGSAAGGSGLVGGGLAASGAVKAASVLAAVAIGAGAADATGVVHLPLVHRSSNATSTAAGQGGTSATIGSQSGDSANSDASTGSSAAAGARGDSQGRGKPGFASGDGRGTATGGSHGSAQSAAAESNGRAVGHTSQGGAHGSASNASATGLAQSSRGSSNSQSHGNAGGSSTSHGANAGGSSQSQQAPGRTKPAGAPATPPSNGGSGGAAGGTHGNGQAAGGQSNAGGQGSGQGLGSAPGGNNPGGNGNGNGSGNQAEPG